MMFPEESTTLRTYSQLYWTMALSSLVDRSFSLRYPDAHLRFCRTLLNRVVSQPEKHIYIRGRCSISALKLPFLELLILVHFLLSLHK
jgi:hypothetical protein